jgi:hypothetical protein
VASAFLSLLVINPLPTSSYASVSFGSYRYALGPGFSLVNKTIAGYQRDEVYIGTAEERAARTTLMMTNSSTWDLDILVKLPVLLRTYPLAEADEVRCIRQGVPRFHEGNGEWYE